MTRPTRKELNLWTPFTVFTAPLWVLLFVTSIAVGALVWVVDTRACSLLKPLSGHPSRRHGKRPKRILKTWINDGVHTLPSNKHGAPTRCQAHATPLQSPAASFVVQHGPPLDSVPASPSAAGAAEVKQKQHEVEMPPDAASAPGSRVLEQPNPAHTRQPSYTGSRQQPQRLWSGLSFAPSMAPGFASASSIDAGSLPSGCESDKERSPTILRFIGVRQGDEQNAWRQLRELQGLLHGMSCHVCMRATDTAAAAIDAGLMMTSSFLRMPDMGEAPVSMQAPTAAPAAACPD